MPFPDTALDLVIEYNYAGDWYQLPLDEVAGLGSPLTGVEIVRGYDIGSRRAVPTVLRFGLLNSDKISYSFDHPNCPLYGRIGKNTPLRLHIFPHLLSGPGSDVTDTFTRTVSDGWSTADTGQSYTTFAAGGVFLSTDLSVNGTQGIQSVPAVASSRLGALVDMSLCDMDIYATVNISGIATITGGPLEIGGIAVRSDIAFTDYYLMRCEVATTGALTAYIYYTDLIPLAFETVSGVTWTGQPIRVRARCYGNALMYKVWDASLTEPNDWSVSIVDTRKILPGMVAFRSGVSGTNTNALPVVFTWDNISVQPFIPRFDGFLAKYTYQTDDPTGNDLIMKMECGSFLRRSSQGTLNVRGALPRRILALPNNILYWPLDDGANTLSANSIATAATVFVKQEDISFARVGGPFGAPKNLPELTWDSISSIPALTAMIDYVTGTLWSVTFIAKFDISDIASSTISPITWQTKQMFWIAVFYHDATPAAYWEIIGVDTVTANTLTTHIDTSSIYDNKWHYFHVQFQQSGTTGSVIAAIDDFTLIDSDSATVDGSYFRDISIVLIPRTSANSVSLGHIAIYNDVLVPSLYHEMNGCAGETLSTRISRVCGEDNIAYNIVGDVSSPLLDIQEMDTSQNILQRAVATDLGFLFDRRDCIGWVYRTLRSLCNQIPLELNIRTAHDIVTQPLPSDNDLLAHNQVECASPAGTTVVVTQQTGPQSIVDPPIGIGVYNRGRITIPLLDVIELYNRAYWLRHIGTIGCTLTVPTIGINLVRNNVFTLEPTWVWQILQTDIGDTIAIVEPPAWLPPDNITTIIMSYVERIHQLQWSIEWSTIPAKPYAIGVYDSATSRYDSLDSTLTTAIDSDDVTLSVTFTQARWVRSADSPTTFPIDIMCNGERMRVTAISGLTSPQTFTVTRSINGIVKSHTSGSEIHVVDQVNYIF